MLVIGLFAPCHAQTTVPFTSGPIPPCDTSYFTANVSGVGTLYPPGWGGGWTYSLQMLTINITSEHPWTLQISLTSPEGTTLLLSAFNGAGGQNYTNTTFQYFQYPSITTGTAPFTGDWTAEGGSLDLFDYENADGTWTITVIDTACGSVSGPGPGGIWTPGWFDGGAGNGGFAFYFDPGPPPCWGGIPSDVAYVCAGETVDVVAYYEGLNTGYSFNYWNWSDPNFDPNAASGTQTIQVDATDPWDNCWYSAQFDIVESPPTALGTDQTMDICGSETADLNALFVLSGSTANWSFAGASITSASASTANEPGTYQIIAGTGTCSDTALVTLNVDPGPALGPDQSVSICPGSSLDLTTLYSTAGATADWYFGGNVLTTPTVAEFDGIYTLIATSPGGCSDTAEVTLVVQSLASVGADQVVDLCSNATLDLTSLYSTTGLTSSWSLAGVPVANASAVSTTGTYELIASNGTGCADTAFVTVNAIAPPDLGPDATASACSGDLVDLTSSFLTAGLTTTWTLSGAPVADPTAVDATGLYTVVATAANGCSDNATVDLVVSANPTLGPDQTLTECAGVLVDLTSVYATGSNTTSWTAGGSALADPTSVLTAGTYTLSATNTAGCTASAVVTLMFEASPVLGADQTASICAGSTFDLTALYSTANHTTQWTLGGAAVTDPAAVNATGNYRLVASNLAGCSDTAFVDFVVNDVPVLGADQFFTLCSWQTVDLSTVFPTSGMSVVYTFNSNPLADPTMVHDAGSYILTATNVNGCVDVAEATVMNIECLCVADFVQDAKCMQDPVKFILEADSAVVGVQWNFNGAADNSTEIDPSVRFTRAGEVLVSLQVTLSCGVVDVERTMFIEDCSDSCTVWIPSAFSPNNDEQNDAWSWKGECTPEDFSMVIVDRFGEVIFRTTDPDATWDGTYGGRVSPDGVYVYKVGYRLPYQERKDVVGKITLLR
ncbi:MAG: gliding motility-associated C-terminal domain-containing protein [Flavobacteriales bacterium]|nr:gliding motility-associated C-terminal domain-containing protein [Flavobacteriales bacterium]